MKSKRPYQFRRAREKILPNIINNYMEKIFKIQGKRIKAKNKADAVLKYLYMYAGIPDMPKPYKLHRLAKEIKPKTKTIKK